MKTRNEFLHNPKQALGNQNPSSGDWIKEIIIFTSWGQTVFQANDIPPGTLEHSWSVSQAGAGIYFFRATLIGNNNILDRLVGRLVVME